MGLRISRSPNSWGFEARDQHYNQTRTEEQSLESHPLNTGMVILKQSLSKKTTYSPIYNIFLYLPEAFWPTGIVVV